MHISALTDRFIKDPREVVKAGDIVKVKVLEVDTHRKRIALTMRLNDEAPKADKSAAPNSSRQERSHRAPRQEPVVNNAFAAAFANAKRK